MTVFFWLLLTCYLRDTHAQYRWNARADDITTMAKMLSLISRDVVKNGVERISELYKIRQDNMRTVPFEIGYLTMAVQENYRRMLDKYIIWDVANLYDFYQHEIVLCLEEIEHYYWHIDHLVNMMHEVERKYKVKSTLEEEYVEFEDISTTLVPPHPKMYKMKKDFPPKKKKKVKDLIADWLANVTTPKRVKSDLPKEYGFDLYEWSSDT